MVNDRYIDIAVVCQSVQQYGQFGIDALQSGWNGGCGRVHQAIGARHYYAVGSGHDDSVRSGHHNSGNTGELQSIWNHGKHRAVGAGALTASAPVITMPSAPVITMPSAPVMTIP